MLPCYSGAAEDPCNSLFIEWVYTIDLDREIVQIKSYSGETSFQLKSIPRQLQWAAKYFQKEYDGEEDDDKPTEASVGQSLSELLIPAAPSTALLDKYQSLNVTKVNARMPTGTSTREKCKYIVRELLFSQFMENWRRRLTEYILLCRPVDFIYREVAFAILSLASGAFELLADQSPQKSRILGARLGSPKGERILPDFGSGMHLPNEMPGSAPDGSFYWFKGVLILLAEGLGSEDRLKAAIATVTEIGRDSGHRTFDALATDIRSFTLVRVRDGDMVQHTDAIALTGDSDSHSTSPAMSGTFCGFSILTNFFEIVAAYTLQPYKPVGKAVPNELYDRIIEMVDPDTYVNCSEVSDTFRHYVHQHIRLWYQPDLSSISNKTANFSHHVIKGMSPSCSNLIIFDGSQTQDIESNLRPWNEGDCDSPRWAPIIGQDKRASMLIDCAITCPAITHTLPTAPDPDHEIGDPEYASLREREGPIGYPLHNFRSSHFYISRFAGVGDVAITWEGYLRHNLIESEETIRRPLWYVSAEAHKYLLHRNSASISLLPSRSRNYLKDANGNMYAEIAGLFWLKKAADFEPLMQETALKEVREYFPGLLDEEKRERPSSKGLLVVAFGARVQCFEWNFGDSASPGNVKDPVLTKLAGGAVLDVSVDEQRDRFEKLFMAFRDQTEAKWLAVDKV